VPRGPAYCVSGKPTNSSVVGLLTWRPVTHLLHLRLVKGLYGTNVITCGYPTWEVTYPGAIMSVHRESIGLL